MDNIIFLSSTEYFTLVPEKISFNTLKCCFYQQKLIRDDSNRQFIIEKEVKI